MKKVLLLGALAMTFMMSSCGFTRNAATNENVVETSVVLNQANYKVIGTVTGESEQTYILGIGGLSRESMAEAAISQMYKNAKLKDSQAIINANVFYRSENYIVYNNVRATATGTIIEFKK